MAGVSTMIGELGGILRPRILLLSTPGGEAAELQRRLATEGFDVVGVSDVDAALRRAAAVRPEMIVVEGTPVAPSALDDCRRLRGMPGLGHTPMLLAVASATDAEVLRSIVPAIEGLAIMPWGIDGIVARCHATLRHLPLGEMRGRIWHRHVELDLDAYRVTRAGRAVRLGPTEFRLLVVFMRHPDRIFSRASLRDVLCRAGEGEIAMRSIDAYIFRLRRALNAAGGPKLIRTVINAGYVLTAEDQRVQHLHSAVSQQSLIAWGEPR